MRLARVRIHQQSIYSHSFHRHFLGTFPSSSMKACLWLCQNNDYCRTAAYRPSEQQCYMYEENSYVGTISLTTDGSIVLAFNLCPNDNLSHEPASICFGTSSRQPVSMQIVMNSLQLIKQYSNIATNGFVLSPGEVWVPSTSSPLITVYSFDNYLSIQSVTSGKLFGYFDLDSQMRPIVAYGGQGLYFSWLSTTIDNGQPFWTPCISVTGYIVGLLENMNLINIYNQSNGAFAYTINGSTNTGSTSYRKFACTVHGQILYLASQNAIQQVSIASPGGTKIFTSIFNYTTNNPSFITTDASKRLYSSCSDCSSLNKTFILTTNGTVLAQWPQNLAFAQGKASKYKYYFVTSTVSNILSFYEY
ncbi:unnamed protein product [Adineta steineri]|uniref:Apple domain-containing protein n=1 Tax=Adineta steineri TaxID=433720 RepID=A0A815MYJ7_9BILA|nr:unnamed protein product [Adineta steineri]CAF1461386.1 unnamed protein product [Adineta steineri]CAF3922642.1 unnamed protein product [Adineta steineri]CAF3933601.1 unnamed protein product [Adineta steineri]